MNSNKTQKLVLASLMAAMTCVATMIIQVPSPMNGYIHLGDGFVLLSGILLGPFYGGAAAGIGSMLADLLSGYAYYAIGTLIIKSLAAICGSIIFQLMMPKKNNPKSLIASVISAGIIGGIIVTVGYYFFSALFLGEGFAAATASIPSNILQNVFGIVVSILLILVLSESTLRGYLGIKK